MQRFLKPTLIHLKSLDRILRLAILNHVVKYSDHLDATFSALADPTRRAILAALSGGQASVTELARPYRISLPAVMKHLRVLEDAGLVSQEKLGRTRHCRLAVQPLKQASEWLSYYRTFWESQLNALEKYLMQEQTDHPTHEVKKCPTRKHHRKSRSR
jgi:DNA-binding transcriptional ArsR family regulator